MKHFLPAIVIIAAGCQIVPSGSAPPPPAAPPAGAPAAPAAPAAPVAPVAPDAAAASRPLTIDEALRIALERNPDLITVRQGERVSEAALEVARTYPFNPTLSVDVRPYTREKDGTRDETLVSTAVLQEIEIAGQGKHRRRAGEAEADLARMRTLEEEVKVIAATARSFYTAAYRRQARELEESLARLKEDVTGIVERRFQAGLAASSDVTLAKLEAATARQSAELARAKEGAALTDLRKELAPGLEGDVRPAIDLEALLARGPVQVSGSAEAAAEARPDVRSAEAEARVAVARADLAAASRIPNISAGPLFEKDETGTIFVGLEAQMPIPLINTGGPAARERRADSERTQEALRQARIKARADIAAALAHYQEAWQAASRSSEMTATGGLDADVQRIRDQYEAGQTDIVKVYLAQASLLQARQNHLAALYDLAFAAIDLTAAGAK